MVRKYIRNPETGRRVLATGKKILNEDRRKNLRVAAPAKRRQRPKTPRRLRLSSPDVSDIDCECYQCEACDDSRANCDDDDESSVEEHRRLNYDFWDLDDSDTNNNDIESDNSTHRSTTCTPNSSDDYEKYFSVEYNYGYIAPLIQHRQRDNDVEDDYTSMTHRYELMSDSD